MSPGISYCYNFSKNYINIEVCNWYFNNVTSSIISFWCNIFSICIICLWLNVMCIIPNFFLHANIPTLIYHKWCLIWSFLFECSVFSEHEFVFNFIVVVNSFYIFADIIFINLCLLSLT